MNKQQFINFIRSPQDLDASSILTFENLVKEHPYCQTAESLYALNLYKEDNFKYNSQLRLATAYVPDRKLLKQHIQNIGSGKRQPFVKDEKSPEKKPEKSHKKTKEEENIHLTDLITSLKTEVDSLVKDPNRQKNQLLQTAIDELKQKLEKIINLDESIVTELNPTVKEHGLIHPELKSLRENKQQKNNKLIDKFIQEEPKIRKSSKSDFFDPTGFAQHSLIDKEDVVSETLAKLYLQQGNMTKALHIYKKLCLVYPEKSSFFAAQIEKIRKDQIG